MGRTIQISEFIKLARPLGHAARMIEDNSTFLKYGDIVVEWLGAASIGLLNELKVLEQHYRVAKRAKV